MSAALLRLTGDEFARKVKTRLETLADETDDEAYASRLRMVASGQRPLRTLLADPRWRDAFGAQLQLLAEPPTLDEQQRRSLDEAVDVARRQAAPPTEDQVVSEAADVWRRAASAQDAIRQEELNGWSHVHDSDDGADRPAGEDR